MTDYHFNPNEEQWKEIPGFPGYEVSDHGRVRSFKKQCGKPGVCGGGFKTILMDKPQRILKPCPDKDGYLRVGLCRDGKTICKRVNNLMLTVFIGPCPPGTEGCHSDGKRQNNIIPNLRWDTPKGNQHDRIAHGTNLIGTRNGKARFSDAQIIQMRKWRSQGCSLSVIGEMFGTNKSRIWEIVSRKTWKHIR